MNIKINNKITKYSFLLKALLYIIRIRANPYGILSIRHRLHGWWPRIYSMKYAEIIEIRLIKKIIFK